MNTSTQYRMSFLYISYFDMRLLSLQSYMVFLNWTDFLYKRKIIMKKKSIDDAILCSDFFLNCHHFHFYFLIIQMRDFRYKWQARAIGILLIQILITFYFEQHKKIIIIHLHYYYYCYSHNATPSSECIRTDQKAYSLVERYAMFFLFCFFSSAMNEPKYIMLSWKNKVSNKKDSRCIKCMQEHCIAQCSNDPPK